MGAGKSRGRGAICGRECRPRGGGTVYGRRGGARTAAGRNLILSREDGEGPGGSSRESGNLILSREDGKGSGGNSRESDGWKLDSCGWSRGKALAKAAR